MTILCKKNNLFNIRLYISCLSEKVKSISQFLFLIFFFNVQRIIYDTFTFLNFGELRVADKTHFRQMVSAEMIYSSCLTS